MLYSYEDLHPELKPQAPATDDGDIMRGVKVGWGQGLPTLQGAVGLVGATMENTFGEGGISTGIKNWGLNKYTEGMKGLEKYQRETDDVTVAWDRAKQGDLGALVDVAQYGVGYALGQMAQTGIAAAAGAVAGSVIAPGAGTLAGAAEGAVNQGAIRSLVQGYVEKQVAAEAARLAATAEGRHLITNLGEQAAAQELTKMATASVAGGAMKAAGATAGMAAHNAGMELGSIYADAEGQAKEDGRSLDGGDLARIWGSGLAAAAVETATDRLGLHALTGKVDIGGPFGKAWRGVVGGSVAAAGEAGTEAVQTAIERYGSGKSLTDQDAINDYINSAFMGAIGGATLGGVAGVFTKPHAVVEAQQAAERAAAFGKIIDAKNVDDAIRAQNAAVDTGIGDLNAATRKWFSTPLQTGDEAPNISEAIGRQIALLQQPQTPAIQEQQAQIEGPSNLTSLNNGREILPELPAPQTQQLLQGPEETKLLAAPEPTVDTQTGVLRVDSQGNVSPEFQSERQQTAQALEDRGGADTVTVPSQYVERDQIGPRPMDVVVALRTPMAQRTEEQKATIAQAKATLTPEEYRQVQNQAMQRQQPVADAPVKSETTAVAQPTPSNTPATPRQVEGQQTATTAAPPTTGVEQPTGKAPSPAKQARAAMEVAALDTLRPMKEEISGLRDGVLPVGVLTREVPGFKDVLKAQGGRAAPTLGRLLFTLNGGKRITTKAQLVSAMTKLEQSVARRGEDSVRAMASATPAKQSTERTATNTTTTAPATATATATEQTAAQQPAAEQIAPETTATPTAETKAEPRVSDRIKKLQANQVDMATLSKTAAPGTLSRGNAAVIKNLAKIFGKKLVVFDGKAAGEAAGGMVFKGDPKTIYVNLQAKEAHLAIFGHELMHTLRMDNPKAFDAIAAVIKLKEGGKEAFEKYYGQGADMEELTSDLLGNQFTDGQFWSEVFAEIEKTHGSKIAPTVIRQLGSALMRTVNLALKALGTSAEGFKTDQWVENLSEVKDAMKTALADYAAAKRFEAQDQTEDAAETGKYDQLSGKKLTYEVRIEDTGETAQITVDAQKALLDGERRVSALERLAECVG